MKRKLQQIKEEAQQLTREISSDLRQSSTSLKTVSQIRAENAKLMRQDKARHDARMREISKIAELTKGPMTPEKLAQMMDIASGLRGK